MSSKEEQSKTKRFTKQRQAILETLKNTNSHPDANWIFKKVSKKIPNISLGTVYRNLNILCEEDVVKELSFQQAVTRYEANIGSHHHIICTNCLKIEDIKDVGDCDVNTKLQEKLLENLEYTDISCEILFKGICKDCQNGNNRN